MIVERTERIITTNEEALLLHEEQKGRLKTTSKAKVASREDLALAYIPGVAEPCGVIVADPGAACRYTIKSNTVVIISDGSAILGLGSIGPLAVMPVMEGKTVLFREFGGVSAFPICLDIQDTQEITETVVRITPAFGGIDLEDASAPKYSEIEEVLKERLDIPVLHDDQHGTAIAVLIGVISSLKPTGKKKEDYRMAVGGAGSAGITITKLLLTYKFAHITIHDKSGILSRGADDLNRIQEKMMDMTNSDHRTGALADAMKGAGIFIGVSAPEIVTQGMVASMNKDTILFTMANPVPEIMPELTKAAGAHVVGTGRSDFPNQVNSTVVFSGVFKGALESRVSAITEEMKLVATEAIAGLVDGKGLDDENILPEAFDPRVADAVSDAVEDHVRK